MKWLVALLAALVEGLGRLVLAGRRDAQATEDAVNRGRAEVKEEAAAIVAATADDQARVNQAHRDPGAIAERLLREAAAGSGGAPPEPGGAARPPGA